MLIYKCRVTGDELISDAYKLRPVIDPETKEEVEGLMECDSMMVTKGGGNIDIGAGNAFGGANDDDEGVADTVEKVNNVIDSDLGFGLSEVPLKKIDLKEYLKTYCGAIRLLLKDDPKIEGPRVKAFTQSAPNFCKFLLTKYDDLQFFMSPAFNPDGAMVYSYYRDTTQVFVFIKEGLIEEKC